ncbi:hypothetical protein HDU96_004714 [Phlyctochytrium bullatum]|nr:hypothetical protein HDU96_004714 [Phlyctochytrium bullatum]
MSAIDSRAFVVLAASCLCMLNAGSLFSFSSMGEQLKSRLGFSASDINVVSGVGNAALYVTFLFIGPLYDFCGARVTMLACVVLFTLGYFLMWMAYEGKMGGALSSVGALSVYYFLCGTGSTAAYMAAIGVNVVNFPRHVIGKVTGFLLLFYGLSGTVYSQIYSQLYSPNTGSYLLFLTLSTAAINAVGLAFIVRIGGRAATPGAGAAKEKKVEENAGVDVRPDTAKVETIKVAPLELDSTVPEPTTTDGKEGEEVKDDDENSYATVPEMILRSQSVRKSTTKPAGNQDDGGGLRESVVSRVSRVSKVSKRASIVETLQENLKASMASLNPSQILQTPVFWLYTTAFTFQQGLTYITNVSSIVSTIELKPAKELDALVALHITLTSVFQSVGRLGGGLVVDLPAFSSGKADRSVLFVAGSGFLVIPHLVVAWAGSTGALTQNLLYFCSVCVGLGFGAIGAFFPALTKDYFGSRYYGTACGFVFAAVPLGILLSNQLYGVFYDKATDYTGQCHQSACYTKSFSIFVGLHMICVGSCVGLLFTRLWERKKRRRTSRVAPVP